MGRKSKMKKERAGESEPAAGETIEELRAHAERVCGPIQVEESAPPEIESEFLRHIIAFHQAEKNERSPIDALAEMGKVYKSPSEIDDADLARELARLIDDLSFLGVYLSSTDHLSDRQLYSKLLSDILLEPTTLMPEDPAYGVHIDIIGGFSLEDIQIYLRYYADDRARRDWKKDFPGEEIPPKETPPWDRDRHFPTLEARLRAAAERNGQTRPC